VNPDLDGMTRQPALTPAAAKAAMAAGVKTAAIVNYERYATRPAITAPVKPVKKDAKLKVKAAPKASARRAAIHHTAVSHPPVQASFSHTDVS